MTEQTASRDLTALTEAGLLVARGVGRGRFYVAGEPLVRAQSTRRESRKPLRELYPWMRSSLASSVS